MKSFTKQIISAIAGLAFLATGMMPAIANAAQVTVASDTMTRQKISTASQHTVKFTLPTATSGSESITVTFPAAFTGTAATASTGWVRAGNVFTYAGATTASQVMNLVVTGLINPSTTVNQVITIASPYDSGDITVPIITDDQIKVTAKVNQTIQFNVYDAPGAGEDNAVGFGALSSTASTFATDAGTGSATVTVGGSSRFSAATNASGGYTVSVQGETLASGSNTINAATGTAPTPTVEQFGLNIKPVSATGTITPSYAGLLYDLPPTATAEVIVTKSTQAISEEYGVNYVANIDGATEPGNYSTAMTYTMTANF